MHAHAYKRAHGSLNDFGVIAIRRITGADDVVYAEPVAGPDDGAQVTGVLHPVQSQNETFAGRQSGVFRSFPEDTYRTLRGLQPAHLRYLCMRGVSALTVEREQPEAFLQLFHTFVSLGYEQPEFVAEFLQLQRAHLFYLRFTDAQFVIRNS